MCVYIHGEVSGIETMLRHKGSMREDYSRTDLSENWRGRGGREEKQKCQLKTTITSRTILTEAYATTETCPYVKSVVLFHKKSCNKDYLQKKTNS